MDRRPWLGPLLLVRGWLAEERGFGYTRKHLTPMAREFGGGGDRVGVTVHFPCRLGVGVRASETCTPTQEETGLRLFDLKPQDGACSNFSNVVAHLLGRGIGKKILQEYLARSSSKEKGQIVVLCKFNTREARGDKGPRGGRAASTKVQGAG